jgi:alcohol dehydrogenase
VFDFAPGQTVLCNSLLSSGGSDPDEILIGWTGNGSPRSRAMQKIWRHGSFAQKALYPSQCLTPLPGAEQTDRNLLPFLASLAIADGALRRGGITGGQAVVVTGATGQLGGAAVMLALARGAARIAALGRDRARLEALASLDTRVRPCPLEGKREPDARAVRAALGGSADLAIDFLPHTPAPDATLAAFDALRVGGAMVFAGGVRHELPLPYQQIMRRRLNIAGSFMFERLGAMDTWRLMQSGALDLSAVHAHPFELREIHAAMDKAATLGGLDCALVRPNG